MIDQIKDAKAKVIELFVDQCRSGLQTRSLDDNMAACGQFMGTAAIGVSQRGLHGSAAAIRVLATNEAGNGEVARLVERIVRFVDVELEEQEPHNTIKISELLFALSFVRSDAANLDGIRRKLVKILQDGISQDERGWGYFVGTEKTPKEVIPTAYAVMALDSAGHSLEKPAKYLYDAIENSFDHEAKTPYVEYSALILAVYVLVFSQNIEQTEKTNAVLKEGFVKLWKKTENLLANESVEQNIEYFFGQDTYYVRIPWQLYLIAAAAKISPRWRFQYFSCQERLGQVVDSVKRGKFIYPHSGDKISTRTNAIAFETLSRVEKEARFGATNWIANGVDRFRRSWMVKYVPLVLAFVFICFCIRQWVGSQGMSIGDLAPEFVGALFLYLASIKKS